LANEKYGYGWSDFRGMYDNVSDFFVYRKVAQDVQPWYRLKRMRKYRIMWGTRVIGSDLTSDEADALLKILQTD
jgi:hypothetical protein